ncbi:MAG: amidohydrolase family protein [Alphaproteobacteria bacterium]|nr:amidohydrolase family protein [Alphaproteobacteria bacterium]
MSGERTAYLNARLLDPASGLDAPGALLVQDGQIADLGPDLFKDGAPSVGQVVDCEGLCLAPGLVDMRVQLREPGEEHKETIHTAGAAAAAGGVTTMVSLPNTHPVIDDVSVVEFIARRAQEARSVNVRCYGSVTRGLRGEELTEMGLLAEAGAVGFTDGTRAVGSSLVMRRALSYAKGFGLMIIQHPEDPALAGDGAMNEGEIATRLGLSAIPADAEVIMIERDLRLVALTGGRYHAAHVSTGAAIEAIRKAKDLGLNVTCDTAPHYFALNETAVGDYRTFAKVSPPLRSEDDRRTVVDGLADGTIDAIASDHAPHDQDSKRLPFEQAAFGAVGLETLLPLTLELVHNKHLSLLDALGRLSTGPAKLLGLPGGTLKRGAPADLILFDPEKPWLIEEKKLRSKSKNSPYDTRPVQGQVARTVVGGRTIFHA